MNLNEFIQNIDIQGYAVIMLTDEFKVDKYPLTDNIDEDRLLDIRVFNKDKEYRLFRDNIASDFFYRLIDDTASDSEYKDKYIEKQRLDLDMKKGKDDHGRVSAQGGGTYYIPLDIPGDNESDLKVVVYNYVGYDDNGMAYIKDYRLVEFIKDEKITKLGGQNG